MARDGNENIIKHVYSSLKESVITYQLPPGERLNIEVIAEQLRVSTTPVRESLNRLVAEDLIVLIPRMGFFMKALLEPEIRDLYELNQMLLDWSVNHIAENQAEGGVFGLSEISSFSEKLMRQDHPSNQHVVKFSSSLYSNLARQTGNKEIDLRVRNINDRLHYVRMCECELQSDPKEQVMPLYQLYRDGQFEELRSALGAYHQKRLKLLPGVLRAKSFNSRVTSSELY